jgi:hypothetical protein
MFASSTFGISTGTSDTSGVCEILSPSQDSFTSGVPSKLEISVVS